MDMTMSWLSSWVDQHTNYVQCISYYTRKCIQLLYVKFKYNFLILKEIQTALASYRSFWLVSSGPFPFAVFFREPKATGASQG
jgi:hypothetical protein